MGYRLLSTELPKRLDAYSLRSVRASDAEPIRLWRNSQLPVLRQSEVLSYKDQLVYFWEVVRPDFGSLEPRQILLVLSHEGRRVGYGGLTYIDWRARRGELSFLADPAGKNLYGAHFAAFLEMLLPLAFGILGLHRVWHETYDIRPEHKAVLVDKGFSLEGRLRDHVLINGRYDGQYVDSLVFAILNDEARKGGVA